MYPIVGYIDDELLLANCQFEKRIVQVRAKVPQVLTQITCCFACVNDGGLGGNNMVMMLIIATV